ncbi:MAG: V4R domain-containing protein, partial [Candidatus Rokuibacteriota bacterium]
GARAAASLDGTADERVGRLLRIGGEIGWGEFALERLTATELAVSVRHSPVAESYGPSTVPVCHLIRGVLESLATAAFGRPSTVVETACVAAGAKVCRFVAS